MSDLINREDALEQRAQAECGLHYADCEADNCSCAYIKRILDIPSAEPVRVAYICDGRKCNADCSECFRTIDIEHAKDFKLIGDTYYQQPSTEAVHKPDYSLEADMVRRLKETLSAEAVEVVRCKDCKHKYVSGNGTTQYYVCDFMDAQYEEDGFCHHGESEAEE